MLVYYSIFSHFLCLNSCVYTVFYRIVTETRVSIDFLQTVCFLWIFRIQNKISKKISNPSIRRKLNKIVKNLIPDNFGVIVRTAAENKDSQAFTNDIINTYNIWKKVVKEYKKAEQRCQQDFNNLSNTNRTISGESDTCILRALR